MKAMAKPVSEDVKKGIMYQLFLRMFTQEGTLAAARERLPQIAELGVTCVYLCPVTEADDDMRKEFWSPRQLRSGFDNPKNPYRMKDYFRIDEEYGNDTDLTEFVKCAHGLGMKVMLDLVYLHCGPGAVFLNEHPDFVKRGENGDFMCAEWAFPALNFENAELREYLWSNMEYFIKKFDVDGYRCDVGDQVPLDFWIEGRRRIEKLKKDVIMLNEGLKGEYLGNAFDINYGFQFYDAIASVLKNGGRASEIRRVWEEVRGSYPENGRCIMYMDNHDTASDSYGNRNEKSMGDGGMEAGFVIIYTLDGVPMLYNGNEICDASRHSLWSNRNYGGLHINWDEASAPEAVKRCALLKRLADIRRNCPALYDGTVEWVENSNPDAVLSYIRESGGQKIAVIVNTSRAAQTFDLKTGAAVKKNILSCGAELRCSGGKLSAEFSPRGYAVFEI